MKNKLTFLFVILSCGFSYSQKAKNIEKITIGGLFNYSTPKQEQVTVTAALRIHAPVYKKISIGGEINYSQFFGKYGNYDYQGVIAFARINPYQGFIGEIGYSYNEISLPGRSYRHENSVHGLWASVGYQVKVSKFYNIEFQYRALPMKYLESGVVNSKIYLLGVNYSFK